MNERLVLDINYKPILLNAAISLLVVLILCALAIILNLNSTIDQHFERASEGSIIHNYLMERRYFGVMNLVFFGTLGFFITKIITMLRNLIFIFTVSCTLSNDEVLLEWGILNPKRLVINLSDIKDVKIESMPFSNFYDARMVTIFIGDEDDDGISLRGLNNYYEVYSKFKRKLEMSRQVELENRL